MQSKRVEHRVFECKLPERSHNEGTQRENFKFLEDTNLQKNWTENYNHNKKFSNRLVKIPALISNPHIHRRTFTRKVLVMRIKELG
jgi:hypothetical protein